MVVTSLGSTDAAAYSVVVLPAGAILVGGTSGGAGSGAARYLANGKLDPSFGEAGVFKTDGTAGNQLAVSGLGVEPDNTIVAAVTSNDGAAGAGDLVLRLNANGTLDTAFGSGGEEIITALQTAGPRQRRVSSYWFCTSKRREDSNLRSNFLRRFRTSAAQYRWLDRRNIRHGWTCHLQLRRERPA